MTTTTTTTRYAAHQAETGAIYGVGETREAALADARRELSTARLDDLEAALSGLDVVAITPAAAAYVEKHGGSPSRALVWDRSARSIMLRSEEE